MCLRAQDVPLNTTAVVAGSAKTVGPAHDICGIGVSDKPEPQIFDPRFLIA